MNMTANKHYSVGEIYGITRQAVRTVPFLRATRLGRDRQFTERIQLAVTEVNGCALCSYAHTRFALEAGLSTEEIRALLGGVTEGAPEHQLPAIAFAQHYADTRGHPEVQDWQAVVDYYGEDEALSVLAATRVMMWGNAFSRVSRPGKHALLRDPDDAGRGRCGTDRPAFRSGLPAEEHAGHARRRRLDRDGGRRGSMTPAGCDRQG